MSDGQHRTPSAQRRTTSAATKQEPNVESIVPSVPKAQGIRAEYCPSWRHGSATSGQTATRAGTRPPGRNSGNMGPPPAGRTEPRRTCCVVQPRGFSPIRNSSAPSSVSTIASSLGSRWRSAIDHSHRYEGGRVKGRLLWWRPCRACTPSRFCLRREAE
jgi:hypothetical protein